MTIKTYGNSAYMVKNQRTHFTVHARAGEGHRAWEAGPEIARGKTPFIACANADKVLAERAEAFANVEREGLVWTEVAVPAGF